MLRARVIAIALVTAAAIASPASALAGRPRANAELVGQVVMCNAPEHCFQRAFDVSAINHAGRLAGKTQTAGPHNRYQLRVAPGEYTLEAVSEGLRCSGSATAVAHRTVTANITCLIP